MYTCFCHCIYNDYLMYNKKALKYLFLSSPQHLLYIIAAASHGQNQYRPVCLDGSNGGVMWLHYSGQKSYKTLK